MNYIARTLTFEFLRPVFVGDTIRCETTITELTPAEGRMLMKTTYVCRNQHDKEVLAGHSEGIIRSIRT
jgi:3-hydroxybutyryl-CoA dehydratase